MVQITITQVSTGYVIASTAPATHANRVDVVEGFDTEAQNRMLGLILRLVRDNAPPVQPVDLSIPVPTEEEAK